MLPDPPRRGLAGMLYILTLMLRHQAVGVLPLLLGYKHTVLYLPTPCPLPIAPHDFSQGAKLVESGYATAKAFLEGLGDEISLESVIRSYHAAAVDFHAWFAAR